MKKLVYVSLVLGVLAFSACEKAPSTNNTEAKKESPTVNPKREEYKAKYQFSPREEIFDKDDLHQKLLAELRNRYKQNFSDLKKSVEANKSKLVVAYVSPEFGGKTYVENEPFIKALCAETGVDYVDVTKVLAGKDPLTFTQLPKDGHWSKLGAEIVAGELEKIIAKNSAVKSGTTFPDDQRPKVFGDYKPNEDEIKGNEKDLPYRMKTNSQGLRMDYDLTFPKTKQRVLMLGDSQMYFPFLDNQFTGTALLQAKFADKEILNAANFGYSVDDYVSLYNERAKFAEPDLVILATNGGDITDQYFSHRNLYARATKIFEPTELELSFYPKITAR